ncbi:hypothetical protein [Nocardioides sp.]|uniref:hypothetical protein n=1 Tax=Nocardioides sp. TaxID=35761 RepID=UPI003516185B
MSDAPEPLVPAPLIASGPYEGWSRYADRARSPEGRTVFFRGPGFNCGDCGVNTHDEQEQFMLLPAVWAQATEQPVNDAGPLAPNEAGCLMLCVGCAEARLGRELTPDDFNWAVPLNRLATYSARLMNRMGDWSNSLDAAT